jgi:uncharacterized protein
LYVPLTGAFADKVAITICSGGVGKVPKHQVARLLEPDTRQCYDHFAPCQARARAYWHGGHRRLLALTVTAAVVGVS